MLLLRKTKERFSSFKNAKLYEHWQSVRTTLYYTAFSSIFVNPRSSRRKWYIRYTDGDNAGRKEQLVRDSVFSYGCNEAYEIRTSHQIRSRCSYIEAKSNNWPLPIPCVLLYGARRIREYPAGNPRIIFWYLPENSPLNFSPPFSTHRTGISGRKLFFALPYSFARSCTFPPSSSNSLLRLTL